MKTSNNETHRWKITHQLVVGGVVDGNNNNNGNLCVVPPRIRIFM